MYRVRHEELPLIGSSHNFVGADNGDVNVSVFLFNGLPGRWCSSTFTSARASFRRI